MRRILITDFIRNVADEYAKDITVFMATDRLRDLIVTISPQPDSADYVNYIRYIIDNYKKIITAAPSEFEKYNPDDKLKLSKEFNIIRKDNKGNAKTEAIQFYKLIVEYLGYDWIRNHSYPKFMAEIGIRTCVYCNAQYGVSFKKDKKSKEFTSSYQIDHFLPKSKYPYLATSFFNLQPSCGHCNQMKWSNDAMFNLYTENKDDLSPFRFHVENVSILNFLLTCRNSDLKILLEVIKEQDRELLKNHEERFHVSLKYDNHKEEASDIILMSRFYNKTYLSQLQAQFGAILPQFRRHILNVLLGFPSDEKEIHKRPLTLLRQDLAKQLNLL